MTAPLAPERLAEIRRNVTQALAEGKRGDDFPKEWMAELLGEVDSLRSLLREVEWSATPDDAWFCCPICGGIMPADYSGSVRPSSSARIGHEPACPLAALLRGAP